ncbi:MAG: HAMP domain-containing histidine kinase [Nitrospirae bacterium]|nr:HAMP domain-containing histidine kinase [Nitrospirota bacterium]
MIFLISGLLLLIIPSNAWAFVPHNYPEIYIHQMGHVYFFISCIFIIWTIFHHNLQKVKGWRYILFAEIFFALWNADTFIGHISEFWIEPSQITGSRAGWDFFFREIRVEGKEYLYYVTRYEFFLIFPAVLFFYRGLKEHLKEAEGGVTAAALLPLFPILFSEITGEFVITVLSLLSLAAALRLYRKERGNILWSYLLWLSSSYVVFSLSRSWGHILHPVLIATGREHIWVTIDPISGSFITFTFVVIGTVSLFFFKAYRSYLVMSEDRIKIEAINADLTELNQELETMVAERTMSLMALTVADKIRNPAAVIGWTCKRILEKESVSVRLGENLKDVIDESDKLETIVKDFETLLKSKRSMFKYEDINEILKGVISLVAKEAAAKKVQVQAALSGQPLKINTQKNLLKAAIFHVIRNALEATQEGGMVMITTSGDNDRVVLTISDTGSGIPKENLDKIFDPFFSTKRFRFGIGLPLVKQIVSEHIGEIQVESEVGKGTSFKMIFPVRWTEMK